MVANSLALLKITQLKILHKLILYRQNKPLCSSKAAHVSSVPSPPNISKLPLLLWIGHENKPAFGIKPHIYQMVPNYVLFFF